MKLEKYLTHPEPLVRELVKSLIGIDVEMLILGRFGQGTKIVIWNKNKQWQIWVNFSSKEHLIEFYQDFLTWIPIAFCKNIQEVANQIRYEILNAS